MAEERILPLTEEQVEVTRHRRVTGRVRVETKVDEEEVPVEADLTEETVQVERVPMNHWVDAPVPDRMEGDTLVVSVMEEVPVVQLRLRVVEEIRITRQRSRRHVRRMATRRRERAEVTRRPG